MRYDARGQRVGGILGKPVFGDSYDRRAGILMRILDGMEIESGCCQAAKHIPGVENRLAGATSRWPEEDIQSNVDRLTQQRGWRRQELAGRYCSGDDARPEPPRKETKRQVVEFTDRLNSRNIRLYGDDGQSSKEGAGVEI